MAESSRSQTEVAQKDRCISEEFVGVAGIDRLDRLVRLVVRLNFREPHPVTYTITKKDGSTITGTATFDK